MRNLLTIQAIAAARFYLRKYIPSDGMWHPKYMVSVLSLLVIASFVVAFGPQVGAIIFYGSAINRNDASNVPNINIILKFRLTKSRS